MNAVDMMDEFFMTKFSFQIFGHDGSMVFL